MNISAEGGGPDRQAKLCIEEFNIAMKAVPGFLVATIDEGIGTFEHGSLTVGLQKRSDIGIILPKLGKGSTNIRLKLLRIARVKVAHRGREHDDITQRKGALQD